MSNQKHEFLLSGSTLIGWSHEIGIRQYKASFSIDSDINLSFLEESSDSKIPSMFLDQEMI